MTRPAARRCAALLVAFSALAEAKAVSVGLLDAADACALAVDARVVEIRGGNVVLEIRRAWKAPTPPQTVVLDPSAARQCMELPPAFAVGEEVVLFLDAPKDGIHAMHGGIKVPVPAGGRDAVVGAIDRVFEIAALDEDGRNRAMLGLAASKDPILKPMAHRHIARMRGDRYRPELVGLLESDDPDARRAALESLRFARAPEAWDLILALARDPDPAVVEAASLALAAYGTDAAIDAILGLALHESPRVRKRAMIDLENSPNPRARPALLGFLDDPVPDVRNLARDRLVARLRKGEWADATARIGRLLDGDPREEVRAEIAGIAFEAQDPVLVAPLLAALDGAAPGGALEANALRSLQWFHEFAGPEARRDVEARIGLVRRSVRKGTGGTAAIDILGRAGDGATLSEAAKSHPDPEARAAARRWLERR